MVKSVRAAWSADGLSLRGAVLVERAGAGIVVLASEASVGGWGKALRRPNNRDSGNQRHWAACAAET